MTDTHTHLYMEAYSGEESAAVERALQAGVSHLLLPGVDLTSIEPIRRLHSLYPEQTSMGIGLHPTEVDENWREAVAGMVAVLDREGDYSAIGEVGMDLYHDRSNEQAQREAFAAQLHIAAGRGLPVLIHCREALHETLDVLRAVKEDRGGLPLMVFHSFTGTIDDVRAIREVCDPYFGINGVVTFKNAPKLREALPEIGAERIVLETDAPYLAPVPHRGTRNESSYIPLILNCIASTLDMPASELERITDNNARHFL